MFTIGWIGEAAAASLIIDLQRVRHGQLASKQHLPDILLLVGEPGGGLDGGRGHAAGRELSRTLQRRSPVQKEPTANGTRPQEETRKHDQWWMTTTDDGAIWREPLRLRRTPVAPLASPSQSVGKHSSPASIHL